MPFDQITNPSDPRLAEVARIYTEAIPANERKPIEWLGIAAGRPDFRLTVVSEDTQIVGFCLAFCPMDAAFVLLEYLAIASDHRGRGWGGQLLQRLLAEQSREALIVEVETAMPDDGAGTALRRQQFYRRFGCRRVEGLEYQLPIAGVVAPPMQLFIANAPSPLELSVLGGWLTLIYTDVYAASADDPRLELALGDLSDPVAFD